ncbi:MAG: amidohydrolase family protein [Gemmatimonadetes bacterium]|nr:amidohydrolase family protein [Gemmatimonadota bacterium]
MIVDTHTHFYDPSRPQGVPWPDRGDPFLYRRIMPDDFKRKALSEGVTGTVVVEASAWVEDNQWVLDLAEADPFLLGLVGHLEPPDRGFESDLDRFACHDLFYGIRLGKAPVDDPVYLRALEQLAAHDLTLDLLVGKEWLPGVAACAARFPGLRIVLNHLAHVPVTGGRPDDEWASGIKSAAAHPNVFCKISGMVELAQDTPPPEDPAYYRPVLDVLWHAFGEDRLLYASNWPVSWRYATYRQVQSLAITCFESKGPDVLDKIMGGNSREAYRWVPRG